MMTTEERDEIQEKQAESHGHELGCFEWEAELVVEDLTARGISYERGHFDEVVEGISILDRILMRMQDGTFECHCYDPR